MKNPSKAADKDVRRVKERAALAAAQESYLQWWSQFKDHTAAQSRGSADFTRLKSAVRELQQALAPFGRHRQDNLLRLLDLLQQGRAPRPKAGYLARLDELEGFLGYLGLAADQGAVHGRQPDPFCRAWIWIAAGQWEKTVGAEPTGGTNSRFVRALTDFQDGRDKDPHTPKVTRALVEGALPDFKAHRLVGR